MKRILFSLFFFSGLAVMAFVLCGCVSTGAGSTAATGAAAGGASVGESGDLVKCPEPLGTLAIDADRWNFNNMKIEPLLRLAVQQSNCFVISAAGNKTDSRMQRLTEQQRHSGEYRAGSKQQKGQRVAVDYFLEPDIAVDDAPTSGLSGFASRIAPSNSLWSYTAAAVGAGMNAKATVVTLTLYDIRSAIQIAMSTGSATATDFQAAMRTFTPWWTGHTGGRGALSGYTKTPAGMSAIAAFTDAYNQMVTALSIYKAQDVKGGLGTGGRLQVK